MNKRELIICAVSVIVSAAITSGVWYLQYKNLEKVSSITPEKVKAAIAATFSKTDTIKKETPPVEEEVKMLDNAALENEINKQPVKIIKTEITINGCVATLKNTSTNDIRRAVIEFGGWNEEGFPMYIQNEYSPSYTPTQMMGELNIKPDEERKITLPVTKEIPVYTKSFVRSYDDFNGGTWENPLKKNWEKNYDGKKIDCTVESRECYDKLKAELKDIDERFDKFADGNQSKFEESRSFYLDEKLKENFNDVSPLRNARLKKKILDKFESN